MRIVIVSPAHPLRGGIAASSERLAEVLAAQGHAVEIFSFSLQYPGFLFPGKTQYTDEPAPAGLKIRTLINSVNPFNWVMAGIKLGRTRPDLIICRFWLPFMGPSLGTVLRIARWQYSPVRIVALVDNIIPHEKRPGDRLLARYFTSICDRYVVMSRSVEQEIKTFSGRKPVAYAPHPVYDIYGAPVAAGEARRILGLPEDVPLVLFFGFIRAYKGLDLLLEALALTPRVHLVVAGEPYEAWEPYQQLIDNAGLGDRVHLFTDFIPTDRVALYFSAADLVAQPYRSATQSGISQIAYHFHKPMVVTAVGGLPEIVTHGVSGYVVPVQSSAIAEAIADFFHHQRAEALAAGVKREKERFSWEHLAGVLLQS